MADNTPVNFIKQTLENLPNEWINLTTHRLDIYDESQAKTAFLEQFEELFKNNSVSKDALEALPTAYDYIRLGHPLSCVLEWTLAKSLDVTADQVITFSSATIPILAVLRSNLLTQKKTRIIYEEQLPDSFDAETIRKIYGYHFELVSATKLANVTEFEGTTIYFSNDFKSTTKPLPYSVDFLVTRYAQFGSILVSKKAENDQYISEIQHVRRRETIAMTPSNCFAVLNMLVTKEEIESSVSSNNHKAEVLSTIKTITGTDSKGLVGSSGLSIQYAIMMGLIHEADEKYPGKDIKLVIPPNCYGGTNDQARRVAACLAHVEVVDLPVDGDNDMVQSTEIVLEQIAKQDAVPFIVAEIPTNPRVEVPNLDQLKQALTAARQTQSGEKAIPPVFILDQTFCPNVKFIGVDAILAEVQAISYVSGSKFPSGGLCTAGYCVGNTLADDLMEKISLHLQICDNEATTQQMEILAKQMPSMNDRIYAAYLNTRSFVSFISEKLPEAKINFVSEDLAEQGFTPSVFSLDLPTKGNSAEEKETYKRELNHKLINKMITQIPDESKYCVSYGQLKGCYWTIPATSTQGTTKEGDKDYIARVALSGNMDLTKHKEVFTDFVEEL